MTLTDDLVARGEIGGRTVRIVESGAVECHTYPVAPLRDGMVRVRTVTSVISPGTEMTYLGRGATNPYLRKRWDAALRLFVPGEPTQDYPVVFGYRAAGEVVESRAPDVPIGTRVFGRWRHTEFTVLAADDARAQRLPDDLTFDDGADLAQMLPICVNAVSFAEERHVDSPTVVFGCGPIGLILAQVARATGASRVYAVDLVASRLEIARSLGLQAIDANDDVALRVKRELGADAIPVAFECSGNARALNEAIRVVRRRGTVVAVGFYQGEAAGLFLGDEFHHNGIEVRSGQIGNLHPRWQIGALRAYGVELARAKRVTLGGLPRLHVSVDDASAAFDAIASRDALQVALTYCRRGNRWPTAGLYCPHQNRGEEDHAISSLCSGRRPRGSDRRGCLWRHWWWRWRQRRAQRRRLERAIRPAVHAVQHGHREGSRPEADPRPVHEGEGRVRRFR